MASETPLYDIEIKVAEPTAQWHIAPEAGRASTPSREERWLRILSWFFMVVGVLFFATSRSVTASQAMLVVTIFEAIIMVGFSQLVLVFLYRRKSNFIEIGSGFRRLSAKVPEHANLLVDVEVIREGVLTGKDTGYIWLDSGTWFFKGISTAFRLNQQDVVPIEAWPKRFKPDPANDKAPQRFPLNSLSGRLELRIKVVDPYEDFAKRKRAKEFYREMFDWLIERPWEGIESLLPPLAVHPGLTLPKSKFHGGVVAGLVMVGLDTAVLAGLPRAPIASDLGSLSALAAFIVAGLIFSGLWLATSELRDATVRASLQKKSTGL